MPCDDDIMEKEEQISYINKVSDNYTIIRLDREIEEPCEYRDVFTHLDTMTEKDTCKIVINSTGGDFYTAVEFVNRILLCKGNVIADIFEAASAACLIAFSCPEQILNHYCSVMAHNVAMSSWGKATGSIERLEHFKGIYFNMLLNLLYFLTPEEIEQIKNDKDVYFTREVLMERLKEYEV